MHNMGSFISFAFRLIFAFYARHFVLFMRRKLIRQTLKWDALCSAHCWFDAECVAHFIHLTIQRYILQQQTFSFFILIGVFWTLGVSRTAQMVEFFQIIYLLSFRFCGGLNTYRKSMCDCSESSLSTSVFFFLSFFSFVPFLVRFSVVAWYSALTSLRNHHQPHTLQSSRIRSKNGLKDRESRKVQCTQNHLQLPPSLCSMHAGNSSAHRNVFFFFVLLLLFLRFATSFTRLKASPVTWIAQGNAIWRNVEVYDRC